MRVIQENKTYLAIDFKNQAPLDGSLDKTGNLSSIGIKYEGNSFARFLHHFEQFRNFHGEQFFGFLLGFEARHLK